MGNTNDSKCRILFFAFTQSENGRVGDNLKLKLIEFLRQPFDKSDFALGVTPIAIRQFIETKLENFQVTLEILINNLYALVIQQKEVTIANKEGIVIRNSLRLLSRILPILFEFQFSNLGNLFLWDMEQGKNHPGSQVPNAIKLISALNFLALYPGFIGDNEIFQLNPNQKENEKMPSSQSLESEEDEKSVSTQKKSSQSEPKDILGNKEDTSQIDVQKEMGLWVQLNQNLNQNTQSSNSFFNSQDQQYQENRLALLETMMACFGKSLFEPLLPGIFRVQQGNAPIVKKYINPYLAFILSPKNTDLERIFQSILNSFVTFQFDFLNIKNYGSQVANDSYFQLANLSVRMLLLMFENNINIDELKENFKNNDFFMPIYQFYTQKEFQGRRKCDRNINEIFKNDVIRIWRDTQDALYFHQIIQNLLRLMQQPMNSQTELVANDIAFISFSSELNALMYQFIVHNQFFFDYVMDCKETVKRFLRCIIYHFCNSIDNNTDTQNSFALTMSLLFFVCARREVALILTESFGEIIQLKNFPILTGSFGDVIIIVVSTCMLNSFELGMECRYYDLMSILINISPSVKNINKVASSKIGVLLNLFTDFTFLIKSNKNPFCLQKLFRVIDNLICFNEDTNLHLLVELYRRIDILERVNKINFDRKPVKYFFDEIYIQDQNLRDKFNLDFQIQNHSDKATQDQTQSIKKNAAAVIEEEQEKGFPCDNEYEPGKLYTFDDFWRVWENFNWKGIQEQLQTKNILAQLHEINNYIKTKDSKAFVNDQLIADLRKQHPIAPIKTNPIEIDQLESLEPFQLFFSTFTWISVFYLNQNIPTFEVSRLSFYDISQHWYNI